MGTPKDETNMLVATSGNAANDHERARIAYEGVPHPVRLTQPFYLGQFEVTYAQYREFVEATAYRTDCEQTGLGGWSKFAGNWIRRPEYVWSTPGEWPHSEGEAPGVLRPERRL